MPTMGLRFPIIQPLIQPPASGTGRRFSAFSGRRSVRLEFQLTPSYRPLSLLAELTYRCPLHCPYCSNPIRMPVDGELTTAEWVRVVNEAAELGVLHVFFSGGEPLLHPGLLEMVRAAREEGIYSNLITSAVGFNAAKAKELKLAGLDSVQISFQADLPELANDIAGTKAHAIKLEAARLVQEAGLPLTVNVVLHRRNIDRVAEIIALAERLGAVRLELANTQFYGWAFLNRRALLPTREQVAEAERIGLEAKARLKGRMEVLYVLPDYFGDRPKPCMSGWGQRYMTVNPIGEVMPCPTASGIPGLGFDNVRDRSLKEIWADSEAFNRFRGTEWMPEPCQGCVMREVDFGGCRCQAALLTGDASATDPACSLSPHRSRLQEVLEEEPIQGWAYRVTS